MIIFPAITFCCIWYSVFLFLKKFQEAKPIRFSFIISLLINALITALASETLSIFSILNARSVTVFWLTISILSVLINIYLYKKIKINLRFSKIIFSKNEKLFVAISASILLLTFFTGIIYPPNNFDSLTYHMARISHWIQNENLKPFATHIERQIYQPPLAELIILNFYLLIGSDLLANPVQWLFEIGCLIALSLVAYQLGANRLVQIGTIFVGATVPMVILQSSSTQNDIIVSFFIISFLIFLIQYDQKKHKIYLILAAIALGESWLTKGTAYLFTGSILIFYFVRHVFYKGNKSIITSLVELSKNGIVLLIIALLINNFQYQRNYLAYHDILISPEDKPLYGNEIHTPAALLSNILRNLAIHFGFPGIHYIAQQGVEFIHRFLGLSTLDSRTTYNHAVFDLPMLSNNEDNASNFLHIILIVITLVWLIKNRANKSLTNFRYLLYLSIFMFVLFCGYLKWQPWHSRLHTTIFLLASPACALFLVNLLQKNSKYIWVVGMISVSAFAFVLTNPTRPYLTIPPLTSNLNIIKTPRNEKYYAPEINLWPIQKQLIAFLKNEHDLKTGLIIGNNDLDYLWYHQFSKYGTISHVNVQTASKKFEQKMAYNYIISTKNAYDTLIVMNSIQYRCVLNTGTAIKLFKRVNR